MVQAVSPWFVAAHQGQLEALGFPVGLYAELERKLAEEVRPALACASSRRERQLRHLSVVLVGRRSLTQGPPSLWSSSKMAPVASCAAPRRECSLKAPSSW
jgi:hypothetical protein